MKSLYRILLFVAFTNVSFQTLSQVYHLKAGLNISKCDIKVEGGHLSNEIIFGLNLGGTKEFLFGEVYSVETGLVFDQKGFKLPIDGSTDTINRLAYLDIPINFKYRIDLKKHKLFLSAGPYIGLAVAGSKNWKKNGELYAEKVKWGHHGSNDELKRLDYGLNLGAEYEFGTLGVGVQFGLGLANLRSSGYYFDKQRNCLASICLSYQFGKK
jgi:hypothetical protein